MSHNNDNTQVGYGKVPLWEEPAEVKQLNSLNYSTKKEEHAFICLHVK